MTLDQAKQKVLRKINNNPAFEGQYRIDERAIIENEKAWYIPFLRDKATERFVILGAYSGFIVGKDKGDLHQPGTPLRIEKWLKAYALGLLNGPHDLVISKINDYKKTRDLLMRLDLQYHIPEQEYGASWKIPRSFTKKMIDQRLNQLPCCFKNQEFVSKVDDFMAIINTEACEFELKVVVNPKPHEFGERIEGDQANFNI